MLKEKWQKWSQELDERIADWLKNESEPEGTLPFPAKCKRCGATLQARTVYCSIHDGFSLFGSHSGGGIVHTFDIPECPNANCQNHKPTFWDENLVLRDSTLYGPCIDY